MSTYDDQITLVPKATSPSVTKVAKYTESDFLTKEDDNALSVEANSDILLAKESQVLWE